MKRTQINTSDLPSFDLPLENELLILKLKAEFGAECSARYDNLPPHLVNQFLRIVFHFVCPAKIS